MIPRIDDVDICNTSFATKKDFEASVYSALSHAEMAPRHADRFKDLTLEQLHALNGRLKAAAKQELLKWIAEDDATRATVAA